MYKHLQDNDFLSALTYNHHKTQYARLKVFDKNKQPIEFIEGKITGGSINIDGAAAIRRTCSLSLSTEPGSIFTDDYWSLTHEFEVEIGLENYIDSQYDSIVWFPMGHYVISNFSYNQTVNALTINISGQDLMAKLNGTQGGSFPHEIDFGTIETEQPDGTILLEKVKIQTIVEQALLQYGQEKLENIFISDLPDYGLELLEYKGKTPLYLIISTDDLNVINIINYTLDENVLVQMPLDLTEGWKSGRQSIQISKIPQYWSLGVLDQEYNLNATPIKMSSNDDTDTDYRIVKIEFGSTIGYRKTDLVYAGELILKAGENIVSLLNKIKTMLGNFDYYYDTDGHFVLQKKKDYLQELFSPVDGEIIQPIAVASQYAYEFKDDVLFTSKSIQPQIDNIKNDYVIWAKKASADGGQIDIHARYAIDKKPLYYKSPWGHYEKVPNLILAYQCKKIDNNYYLDCRDGQVYLSNTLTSIYTSQNQNYLREHKYTALKQNDIFYQLTKDQKGISFTLMGQTLQLYNITKENEYRLVNDKANMPQLYQQIIDTENQVEYSAIDETTEIVDYTKLYHYLGGGKTYISYDYDDASAGFRCDWRELIYQMANDYNLHNQDLDFYLQIANANRPHYVDGKTGYEQYYTDLLGFWRLLYNPYDTLNCFPQTFINGRQSDRSYWNIEAYTNPDTILFWFDFLDTGDAPIAQYEVKKIGMRQKIENQGTNNNTNIFISSTPELILSNTNKFQEMGPDGYEALQIPKSMEQLVSISSQGLTVIEQINNLVYNHSYCAQNVNFSAIPMFWLQPNTRIYVEGIGDLILTKISYSLAHNGTMNLTCNKVINALF